MNNDADKRSSDLLAHAAIRVAGLHADLYRDSCMVPGGSQAARAMDRACALLAEAKRLLEDATRR